jgi:hypothetical protein
MPAVDDPRMTWPPGPGEDQLLGELATMIARGGAWRFVHAAVVAADRRDYPDPWAETRDGVAQVVARTLWPAYLAIDASVEDARTPAARSRARLRTTRLELTRVDATGATFTMAAIGNDDVAGAVSHEVGRAFLGQLALDGHPFRSTASGVPTLALGSIAAVYLGLGVVAANSAFHDRTAGEVIGRAAYHEHQIARAGGLDVSELAFLLAVQATVRDDVLPALASLRPRQAREVEAWREVLDPHEDELRRRLGLDARDDEPPLLRAAAPAAVAARGAFAEADLDKAYFGQRVFRVAETRTVGWAIAGAFGGLVLGVTALAIAGPIAMPLLAATAPAGFVVGWWRGRRVRLFRCASCTTFVDEGAATCRGCGGRIVGAIAHANLRLEAEEALEAEDPADRST